MAFTDPQSITVDGVATSLPRVLTGTTVGSFKSADAVKEVTIDPRGSAKRRRNVCALLFEAQHSRPSQSRNFDHEPVYGFGHD
jgi:hypothetical protein